jgi:hypothetical protein
MKESKMLRELELQFWRAKLALASEELEKATETEELCFWAQRWWWCMQQIHSLMP